MGAIQVLDLPSPLAAHMCISRKLESEMELEVRLRQYEIWVFCAVSGTTLSALIQFSSHSNPQSGGTQVLSNFPFVILVFSSTTYLLKVIFDRCVLIFITYILLLILILAADERSHSSTY